VKHPVGDNTFRKGQEQFSILVAADKDRLSVNLVELLKVAADLIWAQLWTRSTHHYDQSW
jgi:hypothetical protein